MNKYNQNDRIRSELNFAENYRTNNSDIFVRFSPNDVLALTTAINTISLLLQQALQSQLNGAFGSRLDQEVGPSKQEPVVPIDKSVAHDYIICLEDGARVMLLKVYLKTKFDMTPDEYRLKWGLDDDYPMVAPSLSEKRSKCAQRVRPHLSRKNAELEGV